MAAGFYLTRLADRSEYVSAQLLPERLLSANNGYDKHVLEVRDIAKLANQ